ncbi:uncharacterized protein buc2l isoform X2 [Pimephales promelas]|uniref:uncharacterized protein buc2l isoform X2 n=1 Tax=Pimephales promelas TaxID=90988 RepID=UPI001955BAC9|nr:uncharacterized protein buc2l isoform X2 [Pimephales promelas]
MAGVLSGSLYAQAPPLPGPLPSRVLHPDEHLHQNQPFYVPNVQPLFPYQWSMPTPYAPYGGFHGSGYGMMPLLLPPYLEVPGYVVPHAQLPILDYRRITPHVAPIIAHQTHRPHFQNSLPVGRVMVSSEVQTEPLCHSIDSHGSQTCSESGRGSGCGSPVSTSPCSSDNKSVACPEGTSTLTQNCNATNTIDITGLSAVPKTEVLQAERVQIKCNEMPSELKIFQELVSQNETDLLQCSLASVQSSEDVVLCSYQSLAVRKEKRKVEAGMLRYTSKHCLPACTEDTVVRTSPSCRTFKTYPKPSRSIVTQSFKAKKKSEMPFHTEKEDGNSTNVPFKILRLPFDLQYHDQPCQLEASIWSVESLMPYVPSSEWMIEKGLLTPQKPLSPLIEPSHGISKPKCVSVGKYQQTKASTKYHGLPHQLETSIWSVESLMPYVPSSEWMMENGLLTPQKPLSPLTETSHSISKPKCVSVGKYQTDASTKYHGLPHQLETSIWSVESLMPYVPSSEWMMENGLLTPQKPLSPLIEPSHSISKPNCAPVEKSEQTKASTKCHGLPHRLETSIWSVESLMPYVPSSEWMMENGLLTPQKPLSPLTEPNHSISKPNCVPAGKYQTDASTKYHGLPHQLESSIWSVESLMPYVPSKEWMVENGFLTPQKPLSSQIKFSDVLSEINQSSSNGIPGRASQQTGGSTKREDSLRSLKAHSPYCPSTSWLADFGNVYYYSKLPIVQQQPNISERRLPKMSLAVGLESSPLRNGKDTRIQRPAIGVLDQKHGSVHNCKRKAKSSPRLDGSAVMCGWVSHSTLEKKLPFCTSCRYTMKGKDHGKLSFSDGLCCKKREIAKMITFDDKRATEGVHDFQKMILGSHVAKGCAAHQPKIRDKTGLLENYQCLNASPAQDKCVDCESRTWEKSGVDCIINPNERLLKRLEKDNARKGTMQAPKTERRIQKRKAYSQELTQQGDTMHTPWRE